MIGRDPGHWPTSRPAGRRPALRHDCRLRPLSAGHRKHSPPRKPLPNIRLVFAGLARIAMKAKIIITPKKAVLDPQGKTVQSALEHMGYQDVAGVHVGKYVEIDLAPGTDRAAAQQALNEACHRFLSNPVIEDYRLEIAD